MTYIRIQTKNEIKHLSSNLNKLLYGTLQYCEQGVLDNTRTAELCSELQFPLRSFQ